VYRRGGGGDDHGKVVAVAEELDVDAMIERFQARARAVRQRGIPPVEGPERKRFMDQARIDFQDYAIIGDAAAKLEDGILTLTVDLRPKDESPGA
jgi:HSP20 family molecular chaperone IbpA